MPFELTDALIERMLVQRAGTGLPFDLVSGIAARVDVTPQRTRGVSASRARFLVLAATLAFVALGLVAALIGGLLNQKPAPTDPSSGASLVGLWLGDPIDVVGVGTSHQPVLNVFDSDLVLGGAGLAGAVLHSVTAFEAPDTLLLRATDDAIGCAPGAAATYRYTTSAGGLILTISAVQDACPDRAAALAGTWYRAAATCESGTALCLRELEAGTFKSVNLDLRTTHAEIGTYDPTFGALTYTVPDGWAVSRDSRTQLWLNPIAEHVKNPEARERSLSVFARVAAYSQADGCPYEALDPPIDATPDAFATWIAGRPSLDAGPIHAITIDGHPGRWLDVRLSASWTSACPWSDGTPYAPLLFFEDGEEGSDGVGLGETERYVFLDLDGSVVFISISASAPASFEDFAAQAMPIVESFEFR